MSGRLAIICGIGLMVLMVAPIIVRDWWKRRPWRQTWHFGFDPAGDTTTCVAVRTDRRGLMHVQSIDISPRKAPTP